MSEVGHAPAGGRFTIKERRQANRDIAWAAGKAMNGLTLAAQVAGVAWTEVGPGSR